jgi:sulfatase maturation enzyme AslB (radical SAM superfamily)
MKFKRKFLKSTLVKSIVSILHSITRRSKFNFIWVQNYIFRKIYWNLFLRNSAPKNVQIEFSTLCNRRCSYCPVSSEPRPKGYMSGIFAKNVQV